MHYNIATTKPTHRFFARQLQEAMRDRGMNQNDLARRLDVSRDSVSCWCRGRSIPTGPNLRAIAAALGKPANHFLMKEKPAEAFAEEVDDAVDRIEPAPREAPILPFANEPAPAFGTVKVSYDGDRAVVAMHVEVSVAVAHHIVGIATQRV